MQKKLVIGIGIGLIVSILIFFFASFGPFDLARGGIQSVAAKPQAFLYGLRTQQANSGELASLKKENQALQKKLINYSRMQRENEALKSQFDISNTAQENIMPALIVGSIGPPGKPHTLIIDKGKNHGMREQMSVTVGNDLVGQISKVDPNYSEVMIITNPKFNAVAQTVENQAKGVIQGYEDFMILDRVVITDKLQNGNIVVSRGSINSEGLGIKPDVIIGKITDVNKNSSEPFQTAQVKSQLDFGNLNYVFVSQ